MIKLVDLLHEDSLDKDIEHLKNQIKNKEIDPEEGFEHHVYFLPGNKVIKFSYDMWKKGEAPPLRTSLFKLFQNHPDVFAKIYKLTDEYVVMEELDNNKVRKELSEIWKDLYKGESVGKEVPPTFTNQYLKNIWKGSYHNILNALYKNVEDPQMFIELKKILTPKNYNLIVNNYTPLLKKLKNINWEEREQDIHNEQLGYNSDGKLKFFDI